MFVLLKLNIFGLVGPLEHSIPKTSEKIPVQFTLAQKGNRLKIEEIKLPPSRELWIEEGL